MAPVHEPTPGNKVTAPMGTVPAVILLIICGICMIIALARKANAVRRVISHRLQILTGQPDDGRIRLSEDDLSPSVAEFLHDDPEGDDLENIEDGMDVLRHATPLPRHPDSDPVPVPGLGADMPAQPSSSTSTTPNVWST
ncbi:hypothetical protein DL96DRAFT_303646 [Flagelloscypha sp. PMI_526]|nr:hypothetical protein DL96DRAFT_303646 [Flagelloscypha sp. PMI_526]